ncbi:MAG: SlyX family protein [Planctomycetota bacterium]|nr:SlyX family protein [Planctomycetota bacterium]
MDQVSRDELIRIQEAQAFTDRTVEELNQQVLEAHRSLERLAGRVAQLEKRLGDFIEHVVSDESDDSEPT